jgi:hypothetical protein
VWVGGCMSVCVCVGVGGGGGRLVPSCLLVSVPKNCLGLDMIMVAPCTLFVRLSTRLLLFTWTLILVNVLSARIPMISQMAQSNNMLIAIYTIVQFSRQHSVHSHVLQFSFREGVETNRFCFVI